MRCENFMLSPASNLDISLAGKNENSLITILCYKMTTSYMARKIMGSLKEVVMSFPCHGLALLIQLLLSEENVKGDTLDWTTSFFQSNLAFNLVH